MSRWSIEHFHYLKMKKGYVEGGTLVVMVMWWIAGVASITRPSGVAYTTNNIYFSSWCTLFSCLYTINVWSESKDILSMAEIVSVSLTLKYWWIHWMSGVVVFVSCLILQTRLHTIKDIASTLNVSQDPNERDALFGIFIGLVSVIVSSFFILIHYDFITQFEEGGWLELFSSLFQIFVWIIALSILTAIDGIAATTNGYNCLPDLFHSIPATDPVDLPPPTSEYAMINCTTLNNGIEEACHVRRLMPGSNLYFACWTCMLSAVAIAFKWKTAKAVNFAQAQAQQQQQAEAEQQQVGGGGGGGSGGMSTGEGYGDDDDDDDDVDD